MSDLIPTRDRIMALLSPPSQEVYLTVKDARWIADEIERLTDLPTMWLGQWRDHIPPKAVQQLQEAIKGSH